MRWILVSCVLVAGVLRGQGTPSPAVAPPLLRIDALGPAAWRAQFLPTNLGSLMASAEGEKLLRPLIEHFDALWRRVAADEAAAVRARVLGFGGPLTVALWADAGARNPPRLHGVIALGARRAEAEPLAADLARGLQYLPQREQREIEGQTFTVTRDETVACTLPKTIDERSVMLVADCEEGLALAAQCGLAWLRADAAAPASTAPLRLRVDLAQAIALRFGLDEQPLCGALGASSLAEFAVSLGADGPHVRAEFELRFRAGERGVFAGLFPERAGVPALGDLVPPGVTGWKAGRFDPLAIWRAGVRAAAAASKRTEAAVLAEAKSECKGVDPGTEILAHLGDEVLVLWQDEGDGQQPGSRTLSLCLAMPVAEDKKVQESLSKMLADSGLELVTDAGVLRSMQPAGWLFPAIHLAVGRGLACLAIGDGGSAQVDAILARAKARKPVVPAEAERWRRRAPAGFNSVGTLGLQTFLRYHLETLFDGVDEFTRVVPIEGRALARELEPWYPLLDKHDLLRVSLLTGCADGCWRLRVLW